MAAKITAIVGYVLLGASILLVLFVMWATVVDGGWTALWSGANPKTVLGAKNLLIALVFLAPGFLLIMLSHYLTKK